MNTRLRLASLIALAAAWLGYFSPWVWPVPAALHLSAHDLVEWLTFMQTVRDGTFPVSRLDLLWPLAGIALLTALMPSLLPRPEALSYWQRIFHWPSLISLAFALFAAFLIFPPYPFVLTAYNDPELAPQFWLGIISGVIAFVFYLLTPRLPTILPISLISLISLISIYTSFRTSALIQPPIADILTQPVPVGYGFVLTLVGFAGVAALATTHALTLLRRNATTDSSLTYDNP